MKTIFAALLMTFSLSARAELTIKTDCNLYGPAKDNLAIAAASMDDPFEIGYLASDVFFTIKVDGCDDLRVSKGNVSCGKNQIGSVERFQSTDDDGGRPRARLFIDKAADVEISGSCNPRSKTQLLFKVKK